MKLPISVLMYQVSHDYDYDYETVNVDVSSAYDGIKLFDEDGIMTEEEKYLYFISEENLIKYHNDFAYSQMLSASVFICLCSGSDSEAPIECRDLSVIFLYAKDKFAYIFNRMQNIVKKFDTWEKSFHLGILRKCSMQELIDITEEFLTHPVLILDNTYKLLGNTLNMTEVGPEMKVIIDRGYASPEDLQNLTRRKIVEDFDSLFSPEINKYQNSFGETNYSIIHKFVASGRIMGYSIAYHCLSHPTDGYLYLMEMLAEKFQLYFEQERQSDNYFVESYQTMLAGILSDSDLSQRQLIDQLGHISELEMEGDYILGQLQYKRINEMSYSFISWSLRNSMPNFMPFVYRDNFYILKDNRTSRNHTGFLTEKEKPLFYKCFNQVDFACGISKPFFSLTELKMAATQCREAISIGNIVRNIDHASGNTNSNSKFTLTVHPGEESMYYYEDIAFYHMLLQLKKVMPLDTIQSSQYRMLKKHEEIHGGDLCAVFLKYILNGCSVTKTATDTYMHRNTILNKVRKATEIMEDDFEDYQTRLFYVISYMAEHSAVLK